MVGLSKLARLVEDAPPAPSFRSATSQIADALHDELGALGAIVVIEANHLRYVDQGRPEQPEAWPSPARCAEPACEDERTRQEAISLITANR